MSTQPGVPSAAFPSLIVLALSAAAICLGLFTASLIQILGAFVDHYTGFMVVGAAVAGWSFSSALENKSGFEGRVVTDKFSPAGNVAISGMIAALFLAAFFLVPVKSSIAFVVLAALLTVLFLCAVHAFRQLISASGLQAPAFRWLALFSAVTGLLAAPLLTDYLGGPVTLAWLAAAGLALSGPVIRFRIVPSLLSLGALLVLVSGAHALHWNPHAVPRMATKLLVDLRMNGEMLPIRATQWGSSTRADVVSFRDIDHSLQWVYTDLNAPIPVPGASGPEAQTRPWLQDRFPVIAIALRVKPIERMLVLAPGPGPETEIARELGIPDSHVYAYNVAAGRIIGPHDKAATTPGRREAVYGNLRALLADDTRRYDMIFLPITHDGHSGRVGSGLVENSFYTRESFDDYLSRLSEHGILAVAVSNELVFARTILTLQALATASSAPKSSENSRRLALWGGRLVGAPTWQDPYRYFVIAANNPDTAALGTRLSELSGGSFVELLFGPGVPANPRQIFSLPQQHVPPEKLAEIITGYFSQRYGSLVSLTPATMDRPFFFHLMADMHPWLKSLLAICLAVIILVVLFARSDRRGWNSPDSAKRPPLPLYLGLFAILGAVTCMLVVGAIGRFSVLSGSTAWTTVCGLAGMFAGVMIGVDRNVETEDFARTRWAGWHASALLVLLALHAAAAYWGDASPVAATLYAPAMLCVLLILGTIMGALLQQGIRRQQAVLRELISWAWTAYGLSSVAGVVVLQWVLQVWGWEAAWWVMACMLIASASIGSWIWSSQFSVAENDSPKP